MGGSSGSVDKITGSDVPEDGNVHVNQRATPWHSPLLLATKICFNEIESNSDNVIVLKSNQNTVSGTAITSLMFKVVVCGLCAALSRKFCANDAIEMPSTLSH